MSRLAKKPITLPTGVSVLQNEEMVEVKGPKGSQKVSIYHPVKIEVADQEMQVTGGPSLESKFLGLYFALISNAVEGVSKGFQKDLKMVGVGYKAVVKGSAIELMLGFSHPVVMSIPEGITVKVEKSVQILISGVDKQKVGQFAADIRQHRPPEPYKGKGVMYVDEHVRRKAGKSAK